MIGGVLIRSDAIIADPSAGPAGVVRGGIRIVGDRVEQVGFGVRASAGDEVIDGRGHVVTPALVNAHIHLGETCLRGMTDGLTLDQYIRVSHSVFSEPPWLDRSDAVHRVSARQTLCECIRSGTAGVCCSRGWDEVDQLGLRGLCGYPLVDTPKLSRYLREPERGLAELGARWDGTRVEVCLYIQSLDNIPDRLAHHCAEILADNAGVRLFIHVAETESEWDRARELGFRSPLDRLFRAGLLGERTLCVHCVHVDDEDIELLIASGASVVLCPVANVRLGERLPRWDLLQLDRVALATDGLAVNGSASLLDTARFTALLSGVDPYQALSLITSQPAHMTGLGPGVIAPGLPADICVWGPSGPGMSVGLDPAADLVHNGHSYEPKHLVVDGRWVLRDGVILTTDELQAAIEFNDVSRRLSQVALGIRERECGDERPVDCIVRA